VKAPDRVLETIAPYETHRVERPTIGIGTQIIDGHDAWVFQATRDLGFKNEAGAALGMVSMPILYLLQGDLAMQLFVQCHRDLTKPAFGVWS
jgi:hypothetical protein